MKGLDVKTIGIFKNPMVGYMIWCKMTMVLHWFDVKP
jgi:hypothetical protein